MRRAASGRRLHVLLRNWPCLHAQRRKSSRVDGASQRVCEPTIDDIVYDVKPAPAIDTSEQDDSLTKIIRELRNELDAAKASLVVRDDNIKKLNDKCKRLEEEVKHEQGVRETLQRELNRLPSHDCEAVQQGSASVDNVHAMSQVMATGVVTGVAVAAHAMIAQQTALQI